MIGLFDVGLGGLSVVRAVRAKRPLTDFVYFSEEAQLGETLPEVRTISRAKVGITTLRCFGAQEIVAALNVVPSRVYEESAQGADVIEMTKPTAHALRDFRGARVLLLAAPATVASEIYDSALRDLVTLESLPLSGLSGAIELGESETVLRSMIRRALLAFRGRKYDVVVLGSTHFPLIRSLLEEEILNMFGGRSVIVDSVDAVAAEVIRRFSTYGSGCSYFYLTKDFAPFRERTESIAPERTVMRTLTESLVA